AARADETDWAEIAQLYGVLSALSPSPVVEMNRAVAVAMLDAPGAGLAILERSDVSSPLDGYRWFRSTRAELLRRLDRVEDAAAAYRRALALSENRAERAFLAGRLRGLSSAPASR